VAVQHAVLNIKLRSGVNWQGALKRKGVKQRLAVFADLFDLSLAVNKKPKIIC
jgi:hypothetical protein